MIIKFLNEEIHLEKSLSSEKIIGVIIGLIEKSGTSFSHLKVDGEICNQDYEHYLSSHLHQIEQIEVITKHLSQMMDESVVLSSEYLERALPEIEILAGELYQGKLNESWDKLAQFIEGLQWLLKVAAFSQKGPITPYYQDYRQFATAVQERLNDLETAMKSSDSVLLADLLTYEFLPVLESLYDGLNKNSN